MSIKKLDPLVARRIAAGEVIDRPASVVRELIDNAIDAHATQITLTLEEGGISLIRVSDNGSGMSKEDMLLCCESHATSKVQTLNDLYHIRTMGFRGEALSSISAVSKTVIKSRNAESAYTLTVDNGSLSPVLPGGPDKGTVVEVHSLFGKIPARREFLKRPASEAGLCRKILLEKAAAYPDIGFTYINNNRQVLSLEPASRFERVLDILKTNPKVIKQEMRELSQSYERFSLTAVTSTPATYRSDRGGIKVFVNGHVVDDYSLIQAVTYGYQEMLPGGCFPYTHLFIEVDPTLADFNIHPAKQEVKLRNHSEIHHAIVVLIQDNISRTIPRIVPAPPQPELFKEQYRPAPQVRKESFASHPTGRYEVTEPKKIDPEWFQKAREIIQTKEDRSTESEDVWTAQPENPWHYIGQAFNLFLVVEKGEQLYLIDQHAAHERVLYNQIISKKDVQKLLIPRTFEVPKDVDIYLRKNLDLYLNFGITLQQKQPMEWEITALPALFKDIESQLVEFITLHTGDIKEIEKGLYAIVACKRAIKKGDSLDRLSAEHLIEEVFRLQDPVCPHGRAFVIRLEKKELMKSVGRIV